MQHQQRLGAGDPGLHVQEVDVDAVDFGHELRDPVQALFTRAPVVSLGPMLTQRAQVGVIQPVLPAGARQRLWPPRARQTLPEVDEDGVRHIDPKFPHA